MELPKGWQQDEGGAASPDAVWSLDWDEAFLAYAERIAELWKGWR